MKKLLKRCTVISLFLAFISVNGYAVPVTLMLDVEAESSNPGTVWASVPIYTGIDWNTVYANPDTTYTWYLPMSEQFEIRANNHPEIVLATVTGINISVKADPIIEIGFAVAAGSLKTYFSFTSDVLSFAPMTNPDAFAYAYVVPNRGDTVIGNFEYGTKAYRAVYNGTGVFANLVGTATGPMQTYEETGWQQIPGTVSSIQSQWWFSLSANGLATGSASFEIVPEPATISLLAIGAIALLRKRK
ncbi:MAG: PEP-CTERM sorting domain-containing protein [Phycisphaerae bacterium]|jgi:hypothetical protein